MLRCAWQLVVVSAHGGATVAPLPTVRTLKDCQRRGTIDEAPSRCVRGLLALLRG